MYFFVTNFEARDVVAFDFRQVPCIRKEPKICWGFGAACVLFVYEECPPRVHTVSNMAFGSEYSHIASATQKIPTPGQFSYRNVALACQSRLPKSRISVLLEERARDL